MIIPIIVDNSPNTAMILGALLSGGDIKKLAEQLVDKENKK